MRCRRSGGSCPPASARPRNDETALPQEVWGGSSIACVELGSAVVLTHAEGMGDAAEGAPRGDVVVSTLGEGDAEHAVLDRRMAVGAHRLAEGCNAVLQLGDVVHPWG